MSIRVGIIGTGGIADKGHAPAIREINGLDLAAVLSRTKTRGVEFLAEHNSGSGIVHTSIDNFTADKNIELAIVCSPDKLHYQQALSCLKAGKHVLVEKPMTLEVDQSKELVELAKANKLTLAIGFHLRSHNGHRALHEQVVNQKVVGEIRHIRAIWVFPQADDSNWRAQSELTKWWSLSAVGSHCIDLVRWFADDTADWKNFKVTTANNLWHGPHDETAIISGQTAGGTTVEVVSSVQFGPYNRIEIYGDKGMAVCEDTMGRLGAGKITVNDELMPYEPISPFIIQLKNIIDNIENGTKLHASGDAGFRSVKDLNLLV